VAVRELARCLDDADLPTHLELGVHETNPASTVCWIAIGMGLALVPSWDALAENQALASLISQACSEGVALARTIGSPVLGLQLAPLVAMPFGLRMMKRVLSAEAIHYAEHHFGHKLRAQHAVMAKEMADLATARGLPHAALSDLATRLLLPSRA
jgi:2-dehydropantoate 2-reductase